MFVGVHRVIGERCMIVSFMRIFLCKGINEGVRVFPLWKTCPSKLNNLQWENKFCHYYQHWHTPIKIPRDKGDNYDRFRSAVEMDAITIKASVHFKIHRRYTLQFFQLYPSKMRAIQRILLSDPRAFTILEILPVYTVTTLISVWYDKLTRYSVKTYT